jgi:hypothetical protein
MTNHLYGIQNHNLNKKKGDKNNMENNKLIAEFMNHYENMGNLGLQYHSDWNWLMEVVEKIKSLDYRIKMNYLSCRGEILSNKNYSSINNHIEVACVGSIPNKYVSNPPTAQNPMYVKEFNCPKEALYNLIVRFIKWYNENNK